MVYLDCEENLETLFARQCRDIGASDRIRFASVPLDLQVLRIARETEATRPALPKRDVAG